MNLIDRIMKAFGWPPPSVHVPQRRLRATCEFCGKDIAVIASTGRLWRHTCADFGVPGPMDPHDPAEDREDGHD